MSSTSTTPPRRVSRRVRLIAALVTATATTSALAAAPECRTMKIDSFDHYFLEYRTSATFPEQPKRVVVDYTPRRPAQPMKACNVSITFDGNALRIKGNSLKDLLRVFSQASYFLYVPQVSSVDRKFFQIDPRARTITEAWGEQSSDDDLAVVAVRIDNGPLKKLLYKGQVFPATYPAGTRVINMYAMHATDRFIAVARMQLDLTSATLTAWYTSPFPKK